MSWDSPHAREFAEMARQLHEEPDTEQTLELIVRFAVQTVQCESAGVFLLHGGSRVESAATTDPVVEKADELQLHYGEGPCLEAMEEHHVLVIRDTQTDRRWPTWTAHAADLGLRSVLSLRLFTKSDTMGALNFYSAVPAAFDEDDAAIASIYAGHASVALAAARQEESLRQAIDARHVIGQAQGILMERFGLTASQAFAVLRRYSHDKNIKLRLVAETVVQSRRLPD